MKTNWRTVTPLLSVALMAAGCGEKPRSPSPSGSTEQAETASQTAESPAADAKAALDGIDRALTKHDLESATVALVNLGLSGQALSDAERLTYQSRMKNLQAQLADAAARNDPKANEMIRLLKASHGK